MEIAMKDGHRSRTIRARLLVAWLVLLIGLCAASVFMGNTLVREAAEKDLELPGLTTDFSLPVMWVGGLSPIAIIVWGVSFGVPVVALVLVRTLDNPQHMRRCFLVFSLFSVAWVVVAVGAAFLGAWLPLSRAGG